MSVDHQLAGLAGLADVADLAAVPEARVPVDAVPAVPEARVEPEPVAPAPAVEDAVPAVPTPTAAPGGRWSVTSVVVLVVLVGFGLAQLVLIGMSLAGLFR